MKVIPLIVHVLNVAIVALDTTEPFEIGFTDNEVYAGAGGIGNRSGGQSIGANYVLGAGITDRLSTILSFSVATDELLAQAQSDLNLTLFFNVIDYKEFEGDLLVTFNKEGAWCFSAELNLDFEKTGFQLTIEEGFENSGSGRETVGITTGIAPLAWWSANDRMQLLTGIDIAFGSGTQTIDIGTAAVGCNVVLSSAIELITEVGFDVPEKGSKATGSISVGILTTLVR